MKKLIISILLMFFTIINSVAQIFTATSDDSLIIQFNSFIDTNLSDIDKKLVSETKSNFVNLLKDNNNDSQNKTQLLIGLNYFSGQTSNLRIYNNFIKAFNSYILSNYSITDCKNFLTNITNSEVNASLLTDWDVLFSKNTISKNGNTNWNVVNPKSIFTSIEDNTPFVTFENANLICDLYDSIVIYNCSGKINFLTKEFKGKNGKIDWQKAGLDKNSVYATLPNSYTVILDNVNFDLDNVTFYHKKYFPNTSIKGNLSDRCIQGANVETSRYPKFIPYVNEIVSINNIYPNVNYTGGFSLEGQSIIGSAINNKNAVIAIHKKGKLFFLVESERFNIKDKSFHTNNAKFKFLTDHDTISHPRSKVALSTSDNELSIYRDAENIGSPPITSTFHKVKIYCDKLTWKMQSDTIFFTSDYTFSRESKAYFESENYFSENRFKQFEARDGKNSLISVLKFYRNTNKLNFHLTEYVDFVKQSVEQSKTSLLLMYNFELLDYDLTTDSIFLRPKLFNYIDNYAKKRDYDVISIFSIAHNEPHGFLDLNKDLITVNGVNKVTVSEKDNVIIFPKNNHLTIKEEMNLEFAGYLQAGLLDFYVQSGVLDYHRFKINFSQIDSMFFYIRTNDIDTEGRRILSKINTPIQDLEGFLNVNQPYNKSGMVDQFDNYPIFTCNGNAFIYYNKNSICDGVYDKERFYFKLDPFEIDSLQTFAPTNISLEGELNSAGIFQNIREPIVVMPDKSLGFEHKTPKDGYPIYGNNGIFKNTIILSNNCFRGSGQLDYLSAELKSLDFVFYPDSAKTILDRVIIQEQTTGVQYPYVEGGSSEMFWNTIENNMVFNTISGDPYQMYYGLVELHGELSYSPKEMGGNGYLINGQGRIVSNDYSFKSQSFTAENADFLYYLPGDKYTSVESKNYSLYMNIPEKSGKFLSNDPKSYIDFKENGFKANFNEFVWKVDKDKLILGYANYKSSTETLETLEATLDKPIDGYFLISENLSNKDLSFYANSGEFDCQSSYLSLNGVDYIAICDAAIFPKDKVVGITSGGALMPINDGFIVLNKQHKYHKLYNIFAEIKSKESFSGTGYYNYTDNLGNKTPLFIETISGNSERVLCRGIINELSPLALNSSVDYSGTITLFNHKPTIDFNGYYNIKQKCFNNDTWVQLADDSDPANLNLPISNNLLSINKRQVCNGFIFSNPGAVIYPAFLTEKNKIPDFQMFNIEGELSFKDDLYLINNNGLTETNNYLTFNTTNCTMEGAGVLNFIEVPGRIQVNSAGSFNYKIVDGEIDMNTSLFLTFHFNKEALTLMANDLNSGGIGSTSNSNFQTNANLLKSDEKYQEKLSSLKEYGDKIPNPDLDKSTIILSDLQLKWDNERKVFSSVAPFTIVAIDGIEVNKTFNGKVEISKAGGTEAITIMILNSGINGNNKYFFMYHNDNMFTYSTNEEFNTLISESPKNKRVLKRYKDLPAYQYITATTEMYLKFSIFYGL